MCAKSRQCRTRAACACTTRRTTQSISPGSAPITASAEMKRS
jgi:hypothetical protein